MKVLLILTAAFDQGGTQNDMIQLSSTLAPLDYDIHLAAPEGSMVKELTDTGATFHPVPSPVGGMRALLSYTRALTSIIRHDNFDVLAPQSIRAALAVGLLRLGNFTAKPVVTSLHNLHNPDNATVAARVLRRCCDLVTFENHYERRLVGLEKTSSGIPTQVVYSGVDLEKFRPRAGGRSASGLVNPAGNLVGCVARFSPEKDHETLLQAWSLHSRQHPDDHLVLIGDGPCRPAIEKAIAMLELGTSVTLMGERPDVDRILPDLDLFVLSSSRESYPRSAREALACGVPVILPAIGGCGEIVLDCAAGSLFQSGDPEGLASLIAERLGDSGGRIPRARAARQHAEANFPIEKWRDTMDGIFRQYGSPERTNAGSATVAI